MSPRQVAPSGVPDIPCLVGEDGEGRWHINNEHRSSVADGVNETARRDGGPCGGPMVDAYFLATSKRSRCMTFDQAAAKSWTNFALPSALA